jgi:hypothetical protein
VGGIGRSRTHFKNLEPETIYHKTSGMHDNHNESVPDLGISALNEPDRTRTKQKTNSKYRHDKRIASLSTYSTIYYYYILNIDVRIETLISLFQPYYRFQIYVL